MKWDAEGAVWENRRRCGREGSVWENANNSTQRDHWIARGGVTWGEISPEKPAGTTPLKAIHLTTGTTGSGIYFQTRSLCTLVASQNPSCSVAFCTPPSLRLSILVHLPTSGSSIQPHSLHQHFPLPVLLGCWVWLCPWVACSSGALRLLPSLFSPGLLSMYSLWPFFLPLWLLPLPGGTL